MQRGREINPLYRGMRPVGGKDRDVEPRLQVNLVTRPDAVDKAPVGRATTKENMLAVVEREAVAADRGGEPSKDGTSLENNNFGSAVSGGQGCRNAGKAATDNAYPEGAHGRIPARLRVATRAFSQVGRETRPWVTAIGSLSMRTRSRW